MVSLSTSVRGLLPWASVLGEKEAESRLNFEKGMGIRVLVRNVEPQQQRLILTLKGEYLEYISRLICMLVRVFEIRSISSSTFPFKE